MRFFIYTYVYAKGEKMSSAILVVALFYFRLRRHSSKIQFSFVHKVSSGEGEKRYCKD